jgi:DNA modification methylase
MFISFIDMNRIEKLLKIVKEHQHQVVSKGYNLIFATNIALEECGFEITDDAEKLKFDSYSGGNLTVTYNQKGEKIIVDHTFTQGQYSLVFSVSDFIVISFY